MSQESKPTKKLQASLAIIVLTAVLVGGDLAFKTKSISATQSSMQPTHTATIAASTTQLSATSSSSPSPSPSPGTYKDGTYTARGSYDSPGGTEGLTVSVMLVSGKVTEANVQSGANDPTAATYQDSFISGYKRYVIGKSIKSIKLSNVSGSSLTSQGFNEALKKIEQQAQA